MNISDNSVIFQYIGDISKALNISSRSIRYYEELGLIVPRRTNGGFREYSEFEVEKLTAILKLKKLGLSLDEIRKLINMKDYLGKKSAGELLSHLHIRLHEFEKKIEEYKDGISEINKLICVIENCKGCRKDAEVFKCSDCLQKRNEVMPELMKAIL